MSKEKARAEDRTVLVLLFWFIAVFFVLFSGIYLFSACKDKTIKKYDANQLGRYVTLIGDSISVYAANELKRALPGVDFEAKSGIKFSAYRRGFGEGGMTRLKQHAMRDVVVFLLGTNGGITDEEINELYTYVGPKHKIILMTTYRDNIDLADWNASIYKAQRERKNTYLLDWSMINYGDPDRYLIPDHVHPNQEGCVYLAEQVRKLVLEALEINE